MRFELKIGEKLFSFISLYRSPSQTQDESDEFTDNLELNLDLAVQNNLYLVVLLGEFNAKSKIWYGWDKTSFEGNVLETLFSQFALHQMINNPIHISDNQINNRFKYQITRSTTRFIYQKLILRVLISFFGCRVRRSSSLTSKLSSSDYFGKIEFKNSLSTTLLSPSLALPGSGYWAY